jgi:hypothetical protein
MSQADLASGGPEEQLVAYLQQSVRTGTTALPKPGIQIFLDEFNKEDLKQGKPPTIVVSPSSFESPRLPAIKDGESQVGERYWLEFYLWAPSYAQLWLLRSWLVYSLWQDVANTLDATAKGQYAHMGGWLELGPTQCVPATRNSYGRAQIFRIALKPDLPFFAPPFAYSLCNSIGFVPADQNGDGVLGTPLGTQPES